MEFKNFSLLDLSDLLKTEKTTSKEIYDYFLERTKKYNPELNAFNTLPEDTPNIGSSGNPSMILPIGIKDAFCEKGIRTTSSSKMLENFIPPYESTVTERMKRAGYIGFGKTNMDEFALGGSGENSAFGATKNPWDLTRIP